MRTYEEHIFEKNNRERIKYIKNHTIYVMYNKTRENAEEYIKSLFGDKNLKDTENYKKLLEFYDKKKRGLQTNKKITKEEKKKYKKIYYADFESTTEGKHKAYMCCVVSENSEKTFLGEDCGNKLLNYAIFNLNTFSISTFSFSIRPFTWAISIILRLPSFATAT